MPQNDQKTTNPLTSLSDFQTAQNLAAGRPRRRPNPEQGQALESLGHAIDYLVDEALLAENALNADVTDAVHLLSSASRAVYLACAETPRDNQARAARNTLVLWKWLPDSTSLLPVFRSRETPGR